MRVLVAGMSSALGGMERRMEFEAHVLRQLGHSVVIATPRFRQLPGWKSQLASQGLEHVVWTPYKVFERMHLALPFRCLALATAPQVKALSLDLAVICVPWNFIGMSMAHVLHHLDIPYVLAIHCNLGVQALNARADRLLRDTLEGCLGAYGVSEPVTESFKRLYGGLLSREIPVLTVMNGVDVNRFSPDSEERNRVREELQFAAQSRVVVFCGRLDRLKRPGLAARAFLNLLAREPRARLLVVGTGDAEDEMREVLTQAGQSASARFVGQVPDTVKYFRAGDCYLSTSSLEGNSLAAAEALSSGLPIVVPDDAVFRSVYGGCKSVRFCAGDQPAVWGNALLESLSRSHGIEPADADVSRAYALAHLGLPAMEDRLRHFYTAVQTGAEQRPTRSRPPLVTGER